MTVPIAVRLSRKLVQSGGCLVWTGTKIWNGYGRITVRDARKMLAHRAAWEAVHGPVPKGLCVLHHCDNRACCNVAHLFLGDLQANVDDMMAKGRHVSSNALKTHCKRGHAYTVANTRHHANGNRFCRECRQQCERERGRRRRPAAAEFRRARA